MRLGSPVTPSQPASFCLPTGEPACPSTWVAFLLRKKAFQQKMLETSSAKRRGAGSGLVPGAAAVLNHLEVSQQISAADLPAQHPERSSRVGER